MFDKNGVEIKTGMVVRIEGAYFKNDNGLYMVEHSAGDPNWLGNYHSLTRILKSGKLSTAKNRLCSYPISIFTNDRFLRKMAMDHNVANATIEVVAFEKTEYIKEHFNDLSKTHFETAKEMEDRGWGSGCITDERNYAIFCKEIADRL